MWRTSLRAKDEPGARRPGTRMGRRSRWREGEAPALRERPHSRFARPRVRGLLCECIQLSTHLLDRVSNVLYFQFKTFKYDILLLGVTIILSIVLNSVFFQNSLAKILYAKVLLFPV